MQSYMAAPRKSEPPWANEFKSPCHGSFHLICAADIGHRGFDQAAPSDGKLLGIEVIFAIRYFIRTGHFQSLLFSIVAMISLHRARSHRSIGLLKTGSDCFDTVRVNG